MRQRVVIHRIGVGKPHTSTIVIRRYTIDAESTLNASGGKSRRTLRVSASDADQTEYAQGRGGRCEASPPKGGLLPRADNARIKLFIGSRR